jgi:hypothetical protein
VLSKVCENVEVAAAVQYVRRGTSRSRASQHPLTGKRANSPPDGRVQRLRGSCCASAHSFAGAGTKKKSLAPRPPNGALARPLQRLVQIRGFQDQKTAHMLLGFQMRTVRDEHFAIGLRPQCAGRAQAAGELPDTRGDHFAIERVNGLHHRFVHGERVVVVGEIAGK